MGLKNLRKVKTRVLPHQIEQECRYHQSVARIPEICLGSGNKNPEEPIPHTPIYPNHLYLATVLFMYILYRRHVKPLNILPSCTYNVQSSATMYTYNNKNAPTMYSVYLLPCTYTVYSLLQDMNAWPWNFVSNICNTHGHMAVATGTISGEICCAPNHNFDDQKPSL